MSPTVRFDLHPEVAGDVTRIWEYIAADSPAAAGRVRQALLDAFRGIARFPGLGHRRPDITSAPVRFKVVGNLLVAYAPLTRPVLILAVIDGRRHPRVIASILRSRQS